MSHKSQKPQATKTNSITQTNYEPRESPLPPPNDLKGYKEVDPNFPERILTMSEKEQEHRHRTIDFILNIQKRGQSFALPTILAFLAPGVYLAISGHDAAAIAFIVSGLVPIVLF